MVVPSVDPQTFGPFGIAKVPSHARNLCDFREKFPSYFRNLPKRLEWNSGYPIGMLTKQNFGWRRIPFVEIGLAYAVLPEENEQVIVGELLYHQLLKLYRMFLAFVAKPTQFLWYFNLT